MYMILEGQHGVFRRTSGIGLDCESASLTVANKSRQADPDALIDGIALYGRGDDDDAALEVIGLTRTGVPTTTCLYRDVSGEPSRRGHCVLLWRRRGARIGWYLGRRTARVQKATHLILEVQADPNRHGGAVPCA